MDNQTDFIASLRAALGKDGSLPQSTKLPPSAYARRDDAAILSRINNRGEEELAALADIFIDNAKPLNLHTHRAGSNEELAAVILQIVEDTAPEFHEEKHIILHDHQELAKLQLWKGLASEKATVHTAFIDDSEVREKTLASYIGITVPDIGIADGAAVLHYTWPGCPRSTSLIPSIHIAVLKQDRLVADVTEAYALLAAEQQLPDSLVFISGPSKTADIEAHLVHGAHGPREMHVIITY